MLHPDLWLWASRILRNKCLLFKSPCLWYSFIGTQTNQESLWVNIPGFLVAEWELKSRALSQAASELSLTRPWNMFVNLCRDVSDSGNNNSRSWKKVFSVSIQLLRAFYVCWVLTTSLMIQWERSCSPESCFIPSQGGGKTKGRHDFVFKGLSS